MSTIKLREVNAIGATPKEFEVEGNTPGGSGIKALNIDLTNINGKLDKFDNNYEFVFELGSEYGELIKQLDNETYAVINIVSLPDQDKIDFTEDTPQGTGKAIYQMLISGYKHIKLIPSNRAFLDGVLFPTTYTGLSVDIEGDGGSMLAAVLFDGELGPHGERVVGPALFRIGVYGLNMQ